LLEQQFGTPLGRKSPDSGAYGGYRHGGAALLVGELEAAATEHTVVETDIAGQVSLHHTTFSLDQVEEFHELYHLAEEAIGADRLDVLLNGRTVPLTRELWLPLIWTLRP